MVHDPMVTFEKVRRMARRRRWLRRARVLVVTVLSLAAAGGAAFGVDRAAVAVHRLWVEHHRPAPVGATLAPTASTTTTVPGPPACTSGQLSAYLYYWRVNAGVLDEVVALSNASGSPCTLAGYVTFAVEAPGGGTLPSPTHDDSSLGADAGASSTPAVVAPGQRGWFEFSYAVACSTLLAPGQPQTGGPGACYQGATLGVLVPGATTALKVTQPQRFAYGTDGFDVGPFGSGTPPTLAPG